MRFICKKCGASFPTPAALGGHLSLPVCSLLCTNYEKNGIENGDTEENADVNPNFDSADGDSDGCTYVGSAHNAHDESAGNAHCESAGNAHCESAGNAVPPLSTRELLQRPVYEYHNHLVVAIDTPQTGNCDTSLTFKLHETQEAYANYCKDIGEQYCSKFWEFFSAVYLEKRITIDKVLQAARDTFICGSKERSLFGVSVRGIRATMLSKAGDFPSLIKHNVTIDLRTFGLPGIAEVKFRFINPLWGWIEAANDMLDAGQTINFKAKEMYHASTSERLYGAGVAFGDKMRWACSRTPPGGYPALFGISFDGADSGISNRNMYPICVQVMNFDGSDPVSCFLLGYIPALNVSTVFKKKRKKLFLAARAHVVQQCVGAILDEIEVVSEHGFSVDLGGERKRLHPFLVAIQVDSKERKTYFGLKSDRSGSRLHHM